MTAIRLLLLTLAPALLQAQAERFGLPACEGAGAEFVQRANFTLCHDSELKVSRWAGHQLHSERSDVFGEHSLRAHFRQDLELEGNSARNSDYRGSGFSRGHLVPAADFASNEDGRRATYVLSNAVPQNLSMNAGKWRQLESAIRALAAQAEATYVFTGPIFAGTAIESIGASRVAVPTHLFKVALVITGERKAMYAAILPNRPANGEPLDSFTTSVDEVERVTGLDFFSSLEDIEEERLEAATNNFYSKPNS